MRAPRWVSELLDSRWAPCVALIAGSLAFVALALLFIPTQFDAARPTTDQPSGFGGPSVPSQPEQFGAPAALGASGKVDPSPDRHVARAPEPTPIPVDAEPVGVVQRGFWPNIADRGDRPTLRAPAAPASGP